MSAKNSRTRRRPATDLLSEDAPLGETSALLAFAVSLSTPPPHIKDQLLARIRAKQHSAPAGWRFGAMASEEGWVPLPFPGVRMREVTTDVERDTALLYVEMAPGAVFPDHDHTATERGMVLSGDLLMGERLLGAGDFYEAAAGTRHERVSSPSGCTGLLWVGGIAWRNWRAAMAAALLER